jgi:hypothetical protein
LDGGNDQQCLKKKVFVSHENRDIAQKPEVGSEDHHPKDKDALQKQEDELMKRNIFVKDSKYHRYCLSSAFCRIKILNPECFSQIFV